MTFIIAGHKLKNKNGTTIFYREENANKYVNIGGQHECREETIACFRRHFNDNPSCCGDEKLTGDIKISMYKDGVNTDIEFIGKALEPIIFLLASEKNIPFTVEKSMLKLNLFIPLKYIFTPIKLSFILGMFRQLMKVDISSTGKKQFYKDFELLGRMKLLEKYYFVNVETSDDFNHPIVFLDRYPLNDNDNDFKTTVLKIFSNRELRKNFFGESNFEPWNNHDFSMQDGFFENISKEY